MGIEWECIFLGARSNIFFTKILTVALDVKTMIHKHKFYEAVYGNGIFNELTYPGVNEGVFNENVKRQNIDMFMTKFRGILFDFNRELSSSFKCMYLFI